MPILVPCSCGKNLQLPDDLAGKKVRCPVCKGVMRVPPAAAPPPPKPAPVKKPASAPNPAASAPAPKPAPAKEPARPSRPAAAKESRPEPKPVEVDLVDLEMMENELEEAEQEEVLAEEEPEEAEADETNEPGDGLLAREKFVVKEKTSLLSSRKQYDILDGDTGEVLGTALEKTGWLAMLLGLAVGKDRMSMTIELRQQPEDELVFSVRRKGLLFKKTQILDGKGRVLGTYKAKLFSLTGGFHIYDQDGKHVAEIRGKWFKSEYTFLTPEGVKMGSVSRKWGGMARELFTSDDTYGVEIVPEYHNDPRVKRLILGAAIVMDAMFQKKGGGKSDSEGGDEGGED